LLQKLLLCKPPTSNSDLVYNKYSFAMSTVSSVQNSPSVSPSLLDRITRRKRMPFQDRSNGDDVEVPALRRRLADSERTVADSEEPIAVQKFTLVSRGAQAVKRRQPQAEHQILMAPPGLAAELGERIEVCRCSECFSGQSRRRICRRDTECHPEYGLLLSMNARFDEEMPARNSNIDGVSLVTEACCREKSAYFILGENSTTVGYVAAVVKANRKVAGRRESGCTREMQVSDSVPMLLQIYVEPEFRRKGLATAALELLLRGHNALLVDDPSEAVACMLKGVGFVKGPSKDGTHLTDGRTIVMFTRDAILADI